MDAFFDKIISTDISILNYIQEHLSCSFLDAVTPVITFLLEIGWIYILLALVFLARPKTRKTGAMLGAALAIGVIVCSGFLKPVTGRIRPFSPEIVEKYGALKTEADLIIKTPTDASWPSGHTVAAFEGAFVLLLRDKRFGIPAAVFAILIGFSRMYQFVHYPTDIIGGIIVGGLSTLLSYLLINYMWKKLSPKYPDIFLED